SSNPHGNEGYPVGDATFRDVILEAQISLVAGDDNDLYGVFVRQGAANAYYCYAMSPAGQCVVCQFDGQYRTLVNAALAPDMKFNKGLNRPNLFQVVACGPNLTLILNDMVITGVLVDPHYKEGYLGFYLYHGGSGPTAELAVDWVQIRGIL